MAKFGHLKRLALSEETTRDYRFAFIVGQPLLTCAPATESNAPYWADLLAETMEHVRDTSPATSQAAMALRAQLERERACRLMGRHCVKGWIDVLDEDGVQVPLSAADAQAWLLAIPVDMWKPFAHWLGADINFRDLPSGVALGKDSARDSSGTSLTSGIGSTSTPRAPEASPSSPGF